MHHLSVLLLLLGLTPGSPGWLWFCGRQSRRGCFAVRRGSAVRQRGVERCCFPPAARAACFPPARLRPAPRVSRFYFRLCYQLSLRLLRGNFLLRRLLKFPSSADPRSARRIAQPWTPPWPPAAAPSVLKHLAVASCRRSPYSYSHFDFMYSVWFEVKGSGNCAYLESKGVSASGCYLTRKWVCSLNINSAQ
ncbi:uncharacterized protein [Aphelocoma coerulescens]|uniref:uncharacterized protein isoform X1 n=1 Tax=Aphelocoma coerulescens TaxID=39617 RepID=UPI003604D7E6